jgi:hypothetical protein
MENLELDAVKLRAWWFHRQGLDGSMTGKPPAEVLERTGWSRSVGGAGPYLTIHSRAGTSRDAIDRAVAALEIHELPTARGCTYVVPASDFAIGLKAGEPFSSGDMKTAAKLGVTEKEVDRLCDAVCAALAKGELDPEGIREATGKASRSLGQEGKKRGLSTTLPLALGRLQARGDIRRVPVNGRLDQQRYRYALWKPNPLTKYRGTATDAQRQMAIRFFRSVGPATLGELQWFSALGVKAARDLVEPLGLMPAEKGSDRLLLPDDLEAFRKFKAASRPQYALIGSLDPLSANRRDVRGLLDPVDYERKVQIEKQLGSLGGIADLPSHAILDRGRLVGLWEYDTETQSIAWAAFVKDKAALEAAVKKTESWVRDELGEARSFSLDSPKSRAPRIAALRKMK